MLPTITLQLTDLANFEPPGTAQHLLPVQTAPTASFAALLDIDLKALQETNLEGGEAFPQDGNSLPVEHGSGSEAIIPVPLPQLQPDAISRALNAAPGPSADAAKPAAGDRSGPGPRPLPEIRVTLAEGRVERPAPLPTVATPVPVDSAAAAPRVPAEAVASPFSGDSPKAEQLPESSRTIPHSVPRLDLDTVSRPPGDPVADNRVIAALTGNADSARPGDRASRAPVRSADVRRDSGVAQKLFASGLTSQGPAPSPQPGPVIEGPEAPSLQAGLSAPAPAAAAAPRFVTTPVPGQVLTEVPIELPVTDAEWGEQLGQRIQLMASNRLQAAEIRLTPAELGPLRIQVAVDDGAASVTFHAQHAVTREAIEQALPRLREMLADNGLTLAQSSVGQQGSAGGGRESAGERETSAFEGTDAPADSAEPDTNRRPERRPDGLVDTFV